MGTNISFFARLRFFSLIVLLNLFIAGCGSDNDRPSSAGLATQGDVQDSAGGTPSAGSEPQDNANALPVAVAGDDLDVPLVGTSILLEGSKSSSSDGQPLIYAWDFVRVPNKSTLTAKDLIPRTKTSRTFTPDVPGIFEVSLVVNDGEFYSKADIVRFQVGDLVSIGNADDSNLPPPVRFVYSALPNPDDPFSSVLARYDFDPVSGLWDGEKFLTLDENFHPRHLVQHPSGKYLFVLGIYEVDFFHPGWILTYSINEQTGNLSLVEDSRVQADTSPTTWGDKHMAVSVSGGFLYVLNDNYISSYRINQETGVVSEIDNSHLHDEAYEKGFVFGPRGEFLYVARQLGIISAYSLDPKTGIPTELSDSPYGEKQLYSSNIAMDPLGRYLVTFELISGSMRVFLIDVETGELSEIGGALFAADVDPRDPVFDPTGQFVYIRTTEGVVVYKLDGALGTLSEVAGSPFEADLKIDRFFLDPSGAFAYFASPSLEGLWVSNRDVVTGALSEKRQVLNVEYTANFVFK